MNLDNVNSLEDWLQASNGGHIIHGRKVLYYSLYDNLRSYLLPIETETTKGALIADIEKQINDLKKQADLALESGQPNVDSESKKVFSLEKIRWLNDHGPDHIEKVIKRVSQLLEGSKADLSSKEAYFLLCAIHLHDIGNFYGRTGHEQKIASVIKSGENYIGLDRIERKYIIQIAEVHGGFIQGTLNKYTIGLLKTKVPVSDEYVHLKFLASLLRFADELADDKSRADITLLASNRLPKSSEIYHIYSSCLNSVMINHSANSIELHFDIPKKFLETVFGYDDKEINIIDYIYERVLKMHKERIYCSRHWKPYLDLENIVVFINFYSDGLDDLHKEITFTLSETGYPVHDNSIYEMCPQLTLKSGVNLDGNYFTKICQDHEKSI